MDVIELLEERIKEAHDVLKTLPWDDPKREKVVAEINALNHDLKEAKKLEMDCNNSNIQNDIAEERLRLEAEKIKAEKGDSRLRFIGGLSSAAIYCFAGGLFTKLAYNMEWVKNILPDRKVLDTARDFFRRIR